MEAWGVLNLMAVELERAGVPVSQIPKLYATPAGMKSRASWKDSARASSMSRCQGRPLACAVTLEPDPEAIAAWAEEG